MALVSVVGTGITAASTLAKLWRKSQSRLLKGVMVKTEEYGWLMDLDDYKVNISAREITAPIQIKRANHAASIVEGGYEATPLTAAPNEVTLTWVNYNNRFSTTITTHLLDELGQDNQIENQFAFQSKVCVEGIADTIGWDFYGFSTGVLCQTSTDATSASQTLTLTNAFGISGLGSASYLASMFQIDDRIGLERAAALVTNGIGSITAVTAATPSIAVTMIGSANVDANDEIVRAQNIENATLSGGTSYNKALTGFLDITTSSSLHGLATSSEANWASGSDAVAGRWSGVKLRKAGQYIGNKGGGKITDVIIDQGVGNDVFASQSGALRFASPDNMRLDGDFSAKGVTFRSSRKTPEGYVFCYDKNNSVSKFSLVKPPSQDGDGDLGWPDGDKMEGQNAYAFSMDVPLAMVCKNRANVYLFSGQTRQ